MEIIKKNSSIKKILALTLAFMMVFTMMPSMAFAEDGTITGSGDEVVVSASVEDGGSTDVVPVETIKLSSNAAVATVDNGTVAAAALTELGANSEQQQDSPQTVSEPEDNSGKITVQLNSADYAVKDASGTDVSISEAMTITVTPGTYYYSDNTGISGSFIVDEDTTEVKLASVTWKSVWPAYCESATITIIHQDGRKFTSRGANADTVSVVPVYAGDSYYKYVFTPSDENYMPIEGHFYVYGDTAFYGLNTSDSGRIPYIPNEYYIVKAPVGMNVQTVWQLKFYTARNFKSYEPTKEEGGYSFYSVPKGMTLRLSQDGKVTRYGSGEEVGTWIEDGTILELRELKDDPHQINRDVGSYYASLISNLPYDSEINLQTGEYFDLVPLRAWQAIDDGALNGHQDPNWHYVVIGGDTDVVSVEITEDDITGQFGRIRANGEGTALVAFYYDAMESKNQYDSDNDDYGLYTWSALWPELTGIAVVNVNDNESNTTIDSNIDLVDGKVVYYVSSQTDELGFTSEMNEYAEYTFNPTATTDGNETAITSVRVYKPIMVADGTLNLNSSNWLTDEANWTTYLPDGEGNYTLKLEEGRNVVEIKAGDSTSYHVILARGLNVKIENRYNPGYKLAVGDTVKVTMEGVLPPVYKMGAIYNPMGNFFYFNGNGAESSASFGQYLEEASFYIELTEEDIGTYVISDGYLSSPSWGEDANAHRALTRNSMVGSWNGGDSDEHPNDKVAIIPDISFEVTSNEDIEEVNAREAGKLIGLCVIPSKSGTSVLNMDIYKVGNPVPQTDSYGTTLGHNIMVGAVPVDKETKILVRSWKGTNSTGAEVEEIDAAKIVYEADTYNPNILHPSITLKPLKSKLNLNLNNCPEVNLEIISIPENGYPVTYARHLCHTAAPSRNKMHAVLTDIIITPESGTFGKFDGILEADDIKYKNSKGDDVTQDLGFGFIGTETHFTTTVPHETDKISLKGVGYGNLGNVIEVKLAGDDTVYKNGEAIKLQPGKNKLTVEYKPSINGKKEVNGRTYTIDVVRKNAPVKIAFDIPDKAEVTVKYNGKTQNSLEGNENEYQLEDGTYDYYVELDGYISKTGSFSATEEKTITVNFEEKDKLPAQSGTVKVNIASQNAVLRSTTSIAISDAPEDLKAKKYVTYNHGGYTVLHALIDACETGNNKIEFSCIKGKLTPKANIDSEGLGSDAGWVCEVNGKVVAEPANTLVNDGDVISYYYNSDYDDTMTHVWLEPENATVTQGESVTLTLMGTPAANDGSEAKAILDADIIMGGETLGKTDAEGKITIAADKLSSLGTYRVTAEKKNNAGQNILTSVLSTLTVKKAPDPSADPYKTTVTFRLIGDARHGDTSENHAYTTWIATKSFTFDSTSVTVGEVFQKALNQAGLSYVGLGVNYIKTITAPEAYGGYDLSEFSNGKNSGWMYTVNGSHPEVGLNDCYVTSGDEIIWHYVDDYLTEVADWSGGSSGNSSTWNKWLYAADVNPPTNGTVIDMSGAEEEATEVTTAKEAGGTTNTTTTPTEVTVSGSTATATVTKENVTETIKQAKENKSTEIVLNVAASDTKGAETVKVQLDTATVKSVVADTSASLTVKTENGQVSLDREALTIVASEAKGTTITLEVVTVSKPTETQQKAAGTNGQVLQLTVKSGDKTISDFNKGKATVTVEISDGLKDKKVAAIYIAEDGKIEQMAGKNVKIDGKDYYTFGTPHFSAFALVDAEELGLEVNDEEANIVKIKELVSDMSLKASSSKTSKKNIKVTLTVDKSTAAAIKEIKEMGYTVKYKYYRSTKKASKYQAKITKTTKTFTNTAGKKGTRYYYKARIQVYDKDGKLITQTALKQCKYAVRMWTK